MSRLWELLSLAPVARAAGVVLVAGLAFPLVGVLILRLRLVTLRFALMHTSLLGSALGLALGWSPLLMGLGANLALVGGLALQPSGDSGGEPGRVGDRGTLFMVLGAGGAFAILHRSQVPAMDTLGLLWGNIYALRPGDFVATLAIALGVLGLVTAFFRPLTALLFSPDIMATTGRSPRLAQGLVVLTAGLVVQALMTLVGALLMDALLLVPALVAQRHARSLGGLFRAASLWGLGLAVLGLVLSLLIDIPLSSGLALTGGLAYAIIRLIKPNTKRSNV